MTAASIRFRSGLWEQHEVRQAFASASDEFEEGDVGAGAGTICYGLKGGIGSASRVIRIGEDRIYHWRAGPVQFWRNRGFCVKWRGCWSKDSGLEAGKG